MDSPPPAKGSKRERFNTAFRRGYERFAHALQPSSRPASPHLGSTAALSTGAISASATLPRTTSLQTTINPPLAQAANTSGLLAEAALPGPSVASGTVHPALAVNPGPTATDRFGEVGNVALSGLGAALRVLEKSADLFPPLKDALSGFIACLDIVQSAATNAGDYEQLTLELTNMADMLNQYVGELGSEDPSGSAGRIARSIEIESARINGQQGRGKGRRMIESAQDKEDVIKSYHTIEGLFRQLQNDIGLRTWRNTNKLPLQHAMLLLQGMSPTDDARYNSGYSTTIKRRGCTAETRQKVQADIQDWIRDPNGAKVYWLNGMAGTGKTTVTYSLCEWLETNQLLGASFFCSRVSSSCRNVNLIVPTIAYQLALSSLAFQASLCKALEADPSISKLNVVQQFEKLLREPMTRSKGAMPEGGVVVIDALDECEDEYGVRLILGTLLKLGASLPLKFFVTSRPEAAIQDHMMSPTGYSPAALHLHDIEQSIVEEDIKKYLTEALGLMSPRPSDEQIEQLAKLAGKLFIYAATAVRYITSGRGDRIARLKAMLTTDPQSIENMPPSKKYRELNELYTVILAAALNDDELEKGETEAMRLVLWTVICAMEPMTIPTLASFLALPEEQVSAALKPLHSVLHVSEGSGLVSTLHASFPDYMFDRHRSGGFNCNLSQHSKLLARRCFDVMKERLRFNICNLESSSIFDKDVSDLDQRTASCIPQVLFYACRYWGEHLRLVVTLEPDELTNSLVDFLKLQLLFWMEVLNLKGCISDGISILAHTENWLSGTQTLANIQKQATDARDFVARFVASACNRSTPHIYLSALPFCSKSSTVYANYWRRMQGLMAIRGTAIAQRNRAAQATWVTDSEIASVAFSFDGTRLVSGSDNHTIQVWNARTGDIVAGPFMGHTNSVNSVTFSPDGTRVVSGSSDCTIRVWDARTGDVTTGPLTGHTDYIRSVSFSLDGTRIVSGSDDRTIRVWDARSGDVTAGPLTEHTDYVRSVGFSPDGTRIVSGSDDETVRIWDARTGDVVAGPLTGHTGYVRSVGFSPDSTRIVSGSEDKTIRVWDARTGDSIIGLLIGHTGPVGSVVFSPDSKRVVSGSGDASIRIWDAHTGDIVAAFTGHTSTVRSVWFSPDSTYVVSGSSDRTIRVWDARADDVPATPSTGHTSPVKSIGFSPDGAHIVSGSYDNTVRAWDARTGEAVAGPFSGHTDWVRSIALSPDGTRVVSGSDDRTIRVWDARTGNVITGPFTGHTFWVLSVAFSPDGTRIVSGSYDKTIRLWDAHTGDVVAGPFTGHTGWVNSVGFSPDGARVVSGSDDRTIRVWDAQTGGDIVEPFTGHTDSVNSVGFSPDGTRIVSGSDDKTIRLWDARVSNVVVRLFEGHTESVTSVAFSPDATLIVSGSYDCTVRVWDALTGDLVAWLFQGHKSVVYSVGFSPDGTRIVSGFDDSTIRVSHFRPRGSSAIAHPRPHGPISTPCSDAPSTPNPIRATDAPSTETPDVLTLGTSHHNSGNGTPMGAGFVRNADGWITSDGIPYFWTPPDLRAHIPFPYDEFVIGPQGALSIDSQNPLLGERWTECYTSPQMNLPALLETRHT